MLDNGLISVYKQSMREWLILYKPFALSKTVGGRYQAKMSALALISCADGVSKIF